jgi:hypothetical protein
MRDWERSSQHFGVHVRNYSLQETGGTVNYTSQKNLLYGNTLRNLQIGFSEANPGDERLGSDYGPNTFDEVVTPYNVGPLNNIVTSAPVGADVHTAASVSVPNNAVTLLPCDVEEWDTDNLHALAGSRLKAPLSGRYQVTALVLFTSNATGYRMVRLTSNAVGYPFDETRNAVNGAATSVAISMTTSVLAKDDYVDLSCLQNSGGALNVSVQSFSLVRIQ